jgi:hypothetical protein
MVFTIARRTLRRSSSAVATNREGHCPPRSSRERQHRRRGRAQLAQIGSSNLDCRRRRLHSCPPSIFEPFAKNTPNAIASPAKSGSRSGGARPGVPIPAGNGPPGVCLRLRQRRSRHASCAGCFLCDALKSRPCPPNSTSRCLYDFFCFGFSAFSHSISSCSLPRRP